MECHECGATISDKAADCPHCGASVRDVSGGSEADDDTGRDDPAATETDTGRPDADDSGTGGATGTPVGGRGAVDPTSGTGSDESTAETDTSWGPTGTDAADADTDSTDTPTETDSTDTPTETDSAETTTETDPAPDTSEPGRSGDPDVADGARYDDDATSESTAETETGWEAAGPPPDREERGGDQEPGIDGEETTIGSESEPGTESDFGEESRFGENESGVGDSEFGRETDTGGREPEIPDRTGETGGAGTDADTDRDSGRGASETADVSEGIRELPFLTGPIAGLVTGAVLTVLSVVVAVLVPGSGFDTVSLGALVLLDLHFATSFHVTPDLFGMFDIVEPPASSLGLLYLLPGLFCYTAAKFVAAYNVDETTPLPLAGAAGGLVAVGYFPVMLVALFLAPDGGAPSVSLPVAILLGGIAYPVFFGFLGGLAAGAFSSSERRVGTLYGVVAFFLMAIGAFVVTLPALDAGDVGLLPQVHASLFTIVSANGFSLGGAGTGPLVLLGYPLVVGVVFAAGFLRAWNASDVEEPLRGAAKGLSPVATYFTLLGIVATLLPILADQYVAGELGLNPAGAAVARGLVDSGLPTISQYIFVVFVGTLVYAVFLGGLGGAVAGGSRYALSDEN